MEQQPPASDAAEKMASALNGIETENPHLKEVLKAFRAILIEQARWKAELPAQDCAGNRTSGTGASSKRGFLEPTENGLSGLGTCGRPRLSG